MKVMEYKNDEKRSENNDYKDDPRNKQLAFYRRIRREKELRRRWKN